MFGVIEGTGYEVLDPRFEACINGNARVERLWTGGRWCEGPAWFAAGRYLVWSDIPNNRMMRFDETDGSVSVFRQPSNNSNGNTVDAPGRLVTCEHLARRVTRTEFDGSVSVIADRFEGKRFNSPNDAVVKSDGSIWFTDPPYGIMSDYEGIAARQEIGGCHVYRVDPATGAVRQMTSDFDKPNGLAFSVDETILYVADTGASHAPDGPRHIRKFAVGADGKPYGRRGLRRMRQRPVRRFPRSTGRTGSGPAPATGCIATIRDGTLIGKIHIPELVANVTFGGPKLNRLFICATTSLYSVMLTTNGAKPG